MTTIKQNEIKLSFTESNSHTKNISLIDEVNDHTIDASIIFDTLLLKRE